MSADAPHAVGTEPELTVYEPLPPPPGTKVRVERIEMYTHVVDGQRVPVPGSTVRVHIALPRSAAGASP